MYALIQNGAVAELFTPPAGFTLAACFHPDVAAQFIAVPQDVTPAQGWTYNGGAFAAPPPPPPPSAVQLASSAYAALIAGGLTVTSTGTPALNGVYSITADSQTAISTEAAFVSVFSEFTTRGTTNLPWQFLDGAFVQFPTPAGFLAFAKAAGQFIAAAKLAAAQGAAMPPASVTIP